MALQLRFAITREDYLKFYLYMFWDSPQNKRKRNAYYLRQIIPLALFIFAFYYTGVFDRNDVFILIVIGLLVLTFVLSILNARSSTLRAAQKIADDNDNESIFSEKNMEVNDNGIFIKTDKLESNYRWDAFTKKIETADYYFLFTSGIYAIIIPKRVFNSSTDKTAFDKMLLQHLSF